MDSFATFLFEIGPYHWLALATLLIGIEMVMPTQYLVWPGAAAFSVGVLGFLVDTSLVTEIAIFSVLSAGLVGVSHFYFPHSVKGPANSLNQRTDQFVGKLATVADDFQSGQGAVTIGDTRWPAQAKDGSDYPAGTRVTVVSADGMLLMVQKS